MRKLFAATTTVAIFALISPALGASVGSGNGKGTGAAT
jgi:hypothetical protein